MNEETSQRRWKKIGEEKQIGLWKRFTVWLNQNWKQLVKEVLMLSIPPAILMFISILLGIATVLAKSDVIKSLIEAEATILGFFGLMIVYILKSLDDKEDRYAQMLFDLQMQGKDAQTVLLAGEDLRSVATERDKGIAIKPESRGGFFEKLIDRTNKQKKAIVRYTRTIGAYLVSSLLLSIGILGMPDVVISGLLSIFAVYLLLVSLVHVFWMFGDIGKTRFHLPPAR